MGTRDRDSWLSWMDIDWDSIGSVVQNAVVESNCTFAAAAVVAAAVAAFDTIHDTVAKDWMGTALVSVGQNQI